MAVDDRPTGGTNATATAGGGSAPPHTRFVSFRRIAFCSFAPLSRPNRVLFIRRWTSLNTAAAGGGSALATKRDVSSVQTAAKGLEVGGGDGGFVYKSCIRSVDPPAQGLKTGVSPISQLVRERIEFT